jgi:hypothetical protein
MLAVMVVEDFVEDSGIVGVVDAVTEEIAGIAVVEVVAVIVEEDDDVAVGMATRAIGFP